MDVKLFQLQGFFNSHYAAKGQFVTFPVSNASALLQTINICLFTEWLLMQVVQKLIFKEQSSGMNENHQISDKHGWSLQQEESFLVSRNGSINATEVTDQEHALLIKLQQCISYQDQTTNNDFDKQEIHCKEPTALHFFKALMLMD